MIGAIIGDILGSVFEGAPVKNYNDVKFSAASDFTDDTVLTIAVADAILTGKSFQDALHQYGNQYRNRGYGGRFAQWLNTRTPQPYNSFGNGSAMRVSPAGWASQNTNEVLSLAEKTAEPTHNHPEGIKGAQAIALSVFLAQQGATKNKIKQQVEHHFQYNLERAYKDIQPGYSFDVTCQGSVPEAIVAFLASNDYASAIRLAVALGGDTDTQACMAGAIAEAFYKEIPKTDASVLSKLPSALSGIVDLFYDKYKLPTVFV